MRDRPVVQEVDDRCNRRSQRSLRLSFRNPWPVRAARTRHGYLRDQREVEGVGVTFALVLEAVLVPPAALADALRPRWTLLAEIAFAPTPAHRAATLGYQASCDAVRSHPSLSRAKRTRLASSQIPEQTMRKYTVGSHLCAPALPQTAAPGDPRPPAPSSLDLDPHLRRVAHAA